MTGVAHSMECTLPQELVKYHNGALGQFTKWHINFSELSKSVFLKYTLLIIFLPMAAIVLPFVYLVSIWRKENIFSSGIFLVSRDRKILLNHKKL